MALPAAELYHYRAYLETLLIYGGDAAASHLINWFCYLDNSNTLVCDPTLHYTLRQTEALSRDGTR
jgi:hypothetical protein